MVEGPTVGVKLTLVDEFSGRLTTAGQKMQATAERMQRVGSQARNAGLALTVAGAAGLYATDKLVKGAASTEQAYARVNTMLGEGEDALADYGSAVKNLTKQIPIQGGEIAALDGMYQVLSAGIEHGADATAVLEASMKAAVGGMTTTETAVDALTTTINAYGLAGADAARISDILFTTVKRGKTTFDELAHAVGPVMALASNLGVSVEQLGGAFATMTKQGAQADQAGMYLRMTMTSMLKPSGELAGVIKDLGYASGSAMIEQLTLQGALEEVAKAVDYDQEAMARLFQEQRALIGVSLLTGDAAEMAAEDLAAMGVAAGAAGDAFGKMADTTSAKLTILETRMQQAKDSIANGATPAMLGLREATTTLMEGVAELNEVSGGMVGALWTIGSTAASVIGPVVALYGQYMMMKAASMMITLARQKEMATTIANTGAITSETAAQTANTAAKTAGATASKGLSLSVGTLGTAVGVVTGVVSGLAIALGTLWEAYKHNKQQNEEHIALLETQTDKMVESGEMTRDMADAYGEMGESVSGISAKMNAHLIVMNEDYDAMREYMRIQLQFVDDTGRVTEGVMEAIDAMEAEAGAIQEVDEATQEAARELSEYKKEVDAMRGAVEQYGDLSLNGLKAKYVELTAAEEEAFEEMRAQADPAVAEAMKERGFAINEERGHVYALLESYGLLDEQIRGLEGSYADLGGAISDIQNMTLASVDATYAANLAYQEYMGTILEMYEGEDISRELWVELGGLQKHIADMANDPTWSGSGAEIVDAFIQGILDKGYEIDDALFDFIRDYIASYLELHSPAKKGPLSTLDHWWDSLGSTLVKGGERGLRDLGRFGKRGAGALSLSMGGGVGGGGASLFDTTNINHHHHHHHSERGGGGDTYVISISGYTAEESEKIARAVSRRLELLKD